MTPLSASDRDRPKFSWRRGLLHALGAPAFIVAAVVLLVLKGSVPSSKLLANSVASLAGEAFAIGLLVSFLFQKRRRVVAWILAGGMVALAAFGFINGWRSGGATGGASGRDAEPWEYRVEKHGFSLTLPSSSWRPFQKPRHIVDFGANPFGAAMLAGLVSVEAQTREEFRSSIPDFKAEFERSPDALDNPVFKEGASESGSPYVFASINKRVASAGKETYLAGSRTWLEDRGITVTMRFEGQRAYQSKLAQDLETQGFEEASRAILLSVKPLAPSAAAAPSRHPRVKAAADRAGKRPAFRFDWLPPCRVPVTEATTVKGKATRMRYFVAVRPGKGKNLEVRLEDFAFLEMDGQNVTGPEWQERLRPALDMTSTIPAFEVSPRGEYLKAERSDEMIERIISERKMPDDEANGYRKLMASPSVESAMQANIGGFWASWVEAWLDWDLRPGETKEEPIVRALPHGGRFPMRIRRQFLASENGYATLQQTATASGAALAAVIAPLAKDAAKAAGRTDVPAQLIKDGQQVTTMLVETDPETLRPRHTHSEAHQRMTFPDGAESAHDEVRDVQWDWDSAEGCGQDRPDP